MQITLKIDTHSHSVFYLMFLLWNGYDDRILRIFSNFDRIFSKRNKLPVLSESAFIPASPSWREYLINPCSWPFIEFGPPPPEFPSSLPLSYSFFSLCGRHRLAFVSWRASAGWSYIKRKDHNYWTLSTLSEIPQKNESTIGPGRRRTKPVLKKSPTFGQVALAVELYKKIESARYASLSNTIPSNIQPCTAQSLPPFPLHGKSYRRRPM
jgi:hypothetical protein